jgi:hypothetical protein
MLLSDLGADVIRIDRQDAKAAKPHQVTHRGRKSVALNLKDPRAISLCLELMSRAEIVFEGFRPGVMERLGLGPDVALKRNPKLVYGRMTGWGQDGPLAAAAGHDINYIARTGAFAHPVGDIRGTAVCPAWPVAGRDPPGVPDVLARGYFFSASATGISKCAAMRSASRFVTITTGYEQQYPGHFVQSYCAIT